MRARNDIRDSKGLLLPLINQQSITELDFSSSESSDNDYLTSSSAHSSDEDGDPGRDLGDLKWRQNAGSYLRNSYTGNIIMIYIVCN